MSIHEKGTPVIPDEDDAPELTPELLTTARPASAVLPKLFSSSTVDALLKHPGRPKSNCKKELVSLRLSPEVLDYFRAQGKGWQTRIDECLKQVAAQGA